MEAQREKLAVGFTAVFCDGLVEYNVGAMRIHCDGITVFAVIAFVAVFDSDGVVLQPDGNLSVFCRDDKRQFSVHSEYVGDGHDIMDELESVLKELFPSVFERFDVDESVDVVLNGPSEVFDLFTEYGVLCHGASSFWFCFVIWIL